MKQPEQQPREYCGNYATCNSIRNSSRTMISHGNNAILLPCESTMVMGKIPCPHDTRKCDATTPDMCCIGLTYEQCQEVSVREKEEASAKAREDVLDELQIYYNNLPEHEASCPYGEMNESEDCQTFKQCDECILNRAIRQLRGKP